MKRLPFGPMSYATPPCILGTFVCCAVSVAQPAPRRETLIAVTHAQIQSAALGQRRDVFVWLPDADAGSASRYPVLVMLDAQDQNNFRSLFRERALISSIARSGPSHDGPRRATRRIPRT